MDKNNRHNPEYHYYDSWERMTPIEQQFEKDGAKSAGDAVSNLIMLILTVIMIANFLSSCD